MTNVTSCLEIGKWLRLKTLSWEACALERTRLHFIEFAEAGSIILINEWALVLRFRRLLLVTVLIVESFSTTILLYSLWRFSPFDFESMTVSREVKAKTGRRGS